MLPRRRHGVVGRVDRWQISLSRRQWCCMKRTLGKGVKALREQQGWSQDRLAEAADVGLRTIQRLEGDEVQPSGETLSSIASALQVSVPQLKFGITAEEISELRDEFLCPQCGAQLIERMSVPNEYGDDLLEIFDCGRMRGARWRPCPADPKFPGFEDYQLHSEQEKGPEGWWSCYAVGQTSGARAVELAIGRGRTREEAEARIRYAYIEASEGHEAAQRFMATCMRRDPACAQPMIALDAKNSP